MRLTKEAGRKLMGEAYAAALKKRSKYGNKRVEVDGHTFDSKAEANRYGELKLLVKKGLISDLVLQPRFPYWHPTNGSVIFTYVADFSYTDHTPPVPIKVVEDIKGVRTALYKLKKKLIEAQYGITITEIDA